jgi:hypothetical protein
MGVLLRCLMSFLGELAQEELRCGELFHTFLRAL